MGDRDQLSVSMDTLFPITDSDRCRVCPRPVVDGRWNYCSERCREVAQAVQRMFIWREVREQVLERDDHTCQECGARRPGTLHVDHITPLADDGHPFDERNLQTLCRACHHEKTAAENRDGEPGARPAPEATLEDYLEATSHD